MILSVLVAEDDPDAQLVLRKHLGNNALVNIIGITGTVSGALQVIGEKRPDIIFLDIELSDGDGFTLLERLKICNHHPYVIFTTGHHQYGFKSIRYAAFDFLFKPVVEDECNEAIDRYLTTRQDYKLLHKIDLLMRDLNSIRKIKFSSHKGFMLIDPEDIFYCIADWNYTEIFITLETRRLVTVNLGKVKEALPPACFFRINRSTIINLKYLSHVDKAEHNCFLSKGGETICFKAPLNRLKEMEKLFPCF
jgi:two-component system, LytTR family, response regulator